MTTPPQVNVAVPLALDISGLRQQIICIVFPEGAPAQTMSLLTRMAANAMIAFPLLLPDEAVDADGNPTEVEFTVIIRNNSTTYGPNTPRTYEAFVVYGTDNEIFAEGLPCYTVESALLNLLDTTAGVIGSLYDAGKLKRMDPASKRFCGPYMGAVKVASNGPAT